MAQSTNEVAYQKKRGLVLTVAGFAFFGCCVFPLDKHIDGWMIEAINLFTFAFAYSFLSHYLAKNLGLGQMKKFVLIVGAATLIGLLCRYLLEYGEVSNIYNFTAAKVIGYTLAVEIYCLIYYPWQIKAKSDK